MRQASESLFLKKIRVLMMVNINMASGSYMLPMNMGEANTRPAILEKNTCFDGNQSYIRAEAYTGPI
jgi:hypothetical protein